MPSSRSDEALAAGALLLSRRSYEWLAARWPSRSGELADRPNNLPKYVVPATLANPAWNNSTVLRGDVLNEVWTRKQHLDGDIVIAGRFQLVRTLIEHDHAGASPGQASGRAPHDQQVARKRPQQ